VPVDLHLHSRFSDGSDEPEEIVSVAAGIGLHTIALTDHDTLEGIGRAQVAADAVGIDLIPGTELSVDWPNGAMHLLVYFLQPGPGPLQDELERIQAGRKNRNHQMVEQLAGLEIDISYDEVEAEAGAGVMGRPHFAAVLMQKGYVDSIKAAFDAYLAAGRPGYVPRLRLEAARAIELASASGAVTAVAHPHTLGVSAADYANAFTRLVDSGLGGIEAYYAEYTPEVRSHLARLAEDLGVVATGGSDYHGTYKPEIRIGSGRGDLIVPDRAAADLHEARARLAAHHT
jgi:hypothetical protein